jgi:hypothetical protein
MFRRVAPAADPSNAAHGGGQQVAPNSKQQQKQQQPSKSHSTTKTNRPDGELSDTARSSSAPRHTAAVLLLPPPRCSDSATAGRRDRAALSAALSRLAHLPLALALPADLPVCCLPLRLSYPLISRRRRSSLLSLQLPWSPPRASYEGCCAVTRRHCCYCYCYCRSASCGEGRHRVWYTVHHCERRLARHWQ